LDQFQQSLPMMLHRTLDSIIPKYREVFKQHGISEQQWRILRVLWETQECTAAELAKRTLLPSPSMVGVIDRMNAKGLVLRDRSTEDRRRVNVRLTEKGRSMQAELQPQIDKVYEQILSQCKDKDLATTINTLQNIIDSN